MLLISRKFLSSRKPIGRKLTFPKTNLPENTHSRNTRKCISENLRSRQWVPRNQIGYIWSSTSHQYKHNAPNIQISSQAEDEKILDTAATACRKMKRAKQTLARLLHPTTSSTNQMLHSLLPPWAILLHLLRVFRILDAVVLLLRTARSIGMPPGPPQSKSSSPATPPLFSSPSPRTVYARFPTRPMKGNPSPQTAMGRGKDPTKDLTGGDSVLALDTSFSPLQNKKTKISLLNGERKAKTKTRIKKATKARARTKVRTVKVDLTSSTIWAGSRLVFHILLSVS